jgi:glycosyltransferase
MVERSKDKNMKISVITATYNSAQTLEDTINSLNIQDYQDIEYIIVDGVSTDSTLKIVEKYRHRVTTLISEKDNGIYDALNKGIALATGDVVGFLHSDDLFTDDKVLSRIAAEFSKESIDAIYGDLHYVSKFDTTKIIRSWIGGNYNINKFRNGWMPAHPTFYMKREHYLSLGGFDLNYSISSDYESMVRYLWKNNLSAAYIPKVFINMRVGGESNRSLANIWKKTKEDLKVMTKSGIPPLRGLLFKNLSKIPQFF